MSGKLTISTGGEEMKQYKIIGTLTVFTLVTIGLLLFSYQTSLLGSIEANDVKPNYDQIQYTNRSIMMKEGIVQLDVGDVQAPISQEIIYEKTEAFINTLLQDIDENYKVKGISTKAALIEEFNDVITEEAVEPYIDFYFEEIEGELYIVPTELPPWFIIGEPYEMKELENGNVVIKQENISEMYGEYQIEIEFSFDKDWRITRIDYPPVTDEQLDII